MKKKQQIALIAAGLILMATAAVPVANAGTSAHATAWCWYSGHTSSVDYTYYTDGYGYASGSSLDVGATYNAAASGTGRVGSSDSGSWPTKNYAVAETTPDTDMPGAYGMFVEASGYGSKQPLSGPIQQSSASDSTFCTPDGDPPTNGNLPLPDDLQEILDELLPGKKPLMVGTACDEDKGFRFTGTVDVYSLTGTATGMYGVFTDSAGTPIMTVLFGDEVMIKSDRAEYVEAQLPVDALHLIQGAVSVSETECSWES